MKFINPEINSLNLDLDAELDNKVHSNILFGSKKFFDILKVNCPLQEDEEILGVNITDTAINIVFRKKENKVIDNIT